MAGLKNVGDRVERDGKFVDLPRREQLRRCIAVAEAGAHDPVAKVLRKSVWVDVYQFGREVGVNSAGGRVEAEDRFASHLQRLSQGLSLVDEHVMARIQNALVEYAVLVVHEMTRGHRIAGIVDELIGRSFSRPSGRKATVAVGRLRVAVAMQVVVGILGARQRPFILIAQVLSPRI